MLPEIEITRAFWFELAANCTGTLAVFLATRNSIHNWWIGIIGSCLFTWVFFDARLYADALLYLFFVIAAFVGWWQWLRGNSGQALEITKTKYSQLVIFALFGVLTTVCYGFLLHRFTDAYAPFVDSFVLAFSVIATFLQIKRRVECWAFWLIVNSVAVPLYVSRGLYLTAFLFSYYWLAAILGWRFWQREHPQKPANA